MGLFVRPTNFSDDENVFDSYPRCRRFLCLLDFFFFVFFFVFFVFFSSDFDVEKNVLGDTDENGKPIVSLTITPAKGTCTINS